MKASDLITRADALIALGRAAMTNTYDMNGLEMVNGAALNEFRSASLSFLKNVFGEDHPYYREFNNLVEGHTPRAVARGLGVLQGARGEIAGGWLIASKALLAADIFADFLEMAEYLLKEGYKDPAAVIIGSVLEDHLRRLAVAHDVSTTYLKDGRDIPKRAETLNVDLAKARVYGSLDQKSVTAWLDLRNKAAHGRYAEYTAEQVNELDQAVTSFMTRLPA